MWGLDRFQRPAWSTGILIPCGFLCGISAAIFIWRGGQKTKRVAEVQERLRAALTADFDILPDHPGIYGVAQRSYKEKLDKLPEHVEESELMVDERMTVPTMEVTGHSFTS